MVPFALAALEALGPHIEGHLPLLLPSLVRLVQPAAPGGVPTPVRRAGLATLRRLLPRLELAPHASPVLHPLLRLVDTGPPDLVADAADTFVALAPSLGGGAGGGPAALFVPAFAAALARRGVRHAGVDRLAASLAAPAPPCVVGDDRASAAAAAAALAAAPDFGEGDDPAATPRWPDTPDGAADDLLGSTAAGGLAGPPPRPAVCEAALRRAWESSQRCTSDDWEEWARRFAVELLRQSPAPALRAVAPLAQAQPAVARELFPAAFVSCWAELSPGAQDALVRSLEAALASPSIPAETVTVLLDLAEFMEHDDRPLPLDSRTLGALAERCHAFAKALHYKEAEFAAAPVDGVVEALISINNHLRQPESAVGVLKVAQRDLGMQLKESWYEKLQRWEEAGAAYAACALLGKGGRG